VRTIERVAHCHELAAAQRIGGLVAAHRFQAVDFIVDSDDVRMHLRASPQAATARGAETAQTVFCKFSLPILAVRQRRDIPGRGVDPGPGVDAPVAVELSK